MDGYGAERFEAFVNGTLVWPSQRSTNPSAQPDGDVDRGGDRWARLRCAKPLDKLICPCKRALDHWRRCGSGP